MHLQVRALRRAVVDVLARVAALGRGVRAVGERAEFGGSWAVLLVGHLGHLPNDGPVPRSAAWHTGPVPGWNDPVDAARHAVDAYDQSGEPVELHEGQRLFVRCEGGPCTSRLEVYPPRLEITEPGGVYVLDDVGPRHEWRYRFVPATTA